MRKIVALILSVLLIFSLSACDKKETTGKVNNKDEFSKTTENLAGSMVPMAPNEISDNAAEQRMESVKNSKDELEFTGRVFYVSMDGDDDNDGKSEDKAWRTINRVNSEGLIEGDAVLFRRGDVFRGKIRCAAGVTYAAYGEGDKPHIYGSTTNYAMYDWEKTETKNVYVCKESVPIDVGLVVMDHGKAYGQKVLRGVSDFKNNYDFYFDAMKAQVYMLCEEGSPEEVFDDIEMCTYGTMVALKDGVTLDNLCLKYAGAHLAQGGDLENITITNCEMGWVGGCIQSGVYVPNTDYTRYGNAFEVWGCGDNITIRNNYIYQVFDAAMTHQYGGTHDHTVMMQNITYADNLVEYSNCAFEYWNTQKDNDECGMKNILFENNVVRYTGYGHGGGRYGTTGGIDAICGTNKPERAENFIIRNNILDASKYNLITAVASEESFLPEMSGNIYIHRKNAPWGFWLNKDERIMFTEDIAQKLSDLGVEQNAQVYFRDKIKAE